MDQRGDGGAGVSAEPRSLEIPAAVLLDRPPVQAYVPIDRALVCAACAVCFTAQRVCPACGGADLYPLHAFLQRQQGRAYVASLVKELREVRALKGEG